MTYFAGLDVSLEETSVCVLDGNGAVVREAKVSTDPEAIASWLHERGYSASKLGFEAGLVDLALPRTHRPRLGCRLSGDASSPSSAEGASRQDG